MVADARKERTVRRRCREGPQTAYERARSISANFDFGQLFFSSSANFDIGQFLDVEFSEPEREIKKEEKEDQKRKVNIWRGAINIVRVCVKASPVTPSQKHGLCPPLGLQQAFMWNIAGVQGSRVPGLGFRVWAFATQASVTKARKKALQH